MGFRVINQKQARNIAEDYISQQNTSDHIYIFTGLKFDKRWPSDWAVVFDVYTSQNTLIDGPVVILVYMNKGYVRSL